jgi:rod shape determining protein RodA
VELLGFVGGGSQRWLNLGFINLQPSELMKVAIVITLAHFYSQLPPGNMRSWTALWPALLMIGIPAGLVMLQPDLGTALAICAGGAIVMFVAGTPLWWFGSAAVAGAAALPVLFSMLHDYQQKRVLIFLDPESDPLGAGYHISQSKIAIGSGGIGGKGFLNGSQSHLDYLPEGHTDFIFATMAEEWGLIGGVALLIAFFLLLRWSTRVALRARTRFGQLTAAGLTMTIFFYIAINLSMVMGMAPVVGIPLPLFSYGGSSMLTIMTCIGIILAIENDSKTGTRRFH